MYVSRACHSRISFFTSLIPRNYIIQFLNLSENFEGSFQSINFANHSVVLSAEPLESPKRYREFSLDYPDSVMRKSMYIESFISFRTACAIHLLQFILAWYSHF